MGSIQDTYVQNSRNNQDTHPTNNSNCCSALHLTSTTRKCDFCVDDMPETMLISTMLLGCYATIHQKDRSERTRP